MSLFKFKYFNIDQSNAPQKVGTDAMVLGALAHPQDLIVEQPKSILDVGTGCGVIALMMAQHFPMAKITGIDSDEQAVLQAQLNFQNANTMVNGFPNSFEAFKTGFLDYQPDNKFDLIISNPPYFNTKMPSKNQRRSLARHESSMSLQDLINHSAELLTTKGSLWIIVPSERTASLVENTSKLHLNHKIQILGKPNRHVRDVLIFTKKNIPETTSQFVIRNQENQYTKAYKALTKDFHYPLF